MYIPFHSLYFIRYGLRNSALLPNLFCGVSRLLPRFYIYIYIQSDSISHSIPFYPSVFHIYHPCLKVKFHIFRQTQYVLCIFVHFLTPPWPKARAAVQFPPGDAQDSTLAVGMDQKISGDEQGQDGRSKPSWFFQSFKSLRRLEDSEDSQYLIGINGLSKLRIQILRPGIPMVL